MTKLEVKKDKGLYFLIIDGEKVLENKLLLSDIVRKIEVWLKAKYLEQEEKSGFKKLFG